MSKYKLAFLIWSWYLILPKFLSGGLIPGDIITHINGKEVKQSADLYDALSEKGKSLSMTIHRGAQQLRVIINPEDPD